MLINHPQSAQFVNFGSFALAAQAGHKYLPCTFSSAPKTPRTNFPQHSQCVLIPKFPIFITSMDFYDLVSGNRRTKERHRKWPLMMVIIARTDFGVANEIGNQRTDKNNDQHQKSETLPDNHKFW